MVKFLVNILSWVLLFAALVFFICIFYFVIEKDSDNAFICVLLGWTSYFLGWGARNYYLLLKNK